MTSRPPILRGAFEGELVIDNFAGGGGASTGIEAAIGRPVDFAINHSPEAIAMHRANHPETKHYCEDIWDVDPRVDLLKMAAPGRKFGRAVQMSVKAGDRFAETMRETSEAVAALGQAFDGISQIIGVDYGESHSVAIIGDTAPDGSVTITHEVWDADRGYIEALQKCCDFDDRILYALAEKGNDANERKACRFLMTARLEAKAARARNVVMRDDFDNLPDAEPRGIVPRPR